jgi:GT2 family glycosyltransferase
MKYAPIIITTYDRLEHLEQTVRALQKNILADQSPLFIYSDAARSEVDRRDVIAVREYIETIDGFDKVVCIERAENYGCAKNIIEAVSEIVEEFGRVIVLEDDIVPSLTFLKYMNDALEKYKNVEKVMEITAYAYPIGIKALPETFFFRLSSSWGWGTWDRAWKYFDQERNAKKIMKCFNRKMITNFDLNNSGLLWRQLKDNARGKLDTWAVFWYAAVYLENGLCLYPSHSLVQNIGCDGSGEHSIKTDYYNVTMNHTPVIYFEEQIVENQLASKLLVDFFNKHKLPIIDRIVNRLKREKVKWTPSQGQFLS